MASCWERSQLSIPIWFNSDGYPHLLQELIKGSGELVSGRPKWYRNDGDFRFFSTGNLTADYKSRIGVTIR
jgi:hypothetical protein